MSGGGVLMALGRATDADLARWPLPDLREMDRVLALAERQAALRDRTPDVWLGDKFWRENDRILTDTRAARARLRLYLR